MEIYKQREYDVRNIIDDISGLSGLFENYVEEVNEFIDYLLEDTKEINTLKQELQRKDNKIKDLKSSIADYQEAVGDYQDELKRKDNIINELKQNKRDYECENILEMKLHILDNNWNELKEWLDKRSELTNMGIVLDKMEELESK